ncbi:uncharacterized protein F5147DRAFT_250735 [Suillus discolor]|uniref:Uncharacterized protein n=1 Tax=Suillus discolor TaxID=1912936 RepID=A0A9P7JZE7_9AGAM|nr:uncharacterized protein F5147DRAFT_250735 [Suillus discolor]KAG2117860.1 hypothetical protein F5147DRAFT_250735 [Suillus discolor]
MEYRDLALSSDNLSLNRGLFEIWQKEHALLNCHWRILSTTNLLSIRCFIASVMNYPRGQPHCKYKGVKKIVWTSEPRATPSLILLAFLPSFSFNLCRLLFFISPLIFFIQLWFAGLHAVHHWSMVRVIAGELDIKLDDDFGFAPSTLVHKGSEALLGKAKI